MHPSDVQASEPLEGRWGKVDVVAIAVSASVDNPHSDGSAVAVDLGVVVADRVAVIRG